MTKPTYVCLMKKVTLLISFAGLLILIGCNQCTTDTPPAGDGNTTDTSGIPADEISILSWNLESDGSDIDTLVNQLKIEGSFDLYGFSEVKSIDWAYKIKEAIEEISTHRYRFILGTTGRSDRLMILYDTSRFGELDQFEIDSINVGGNVRAPLVAKLKETDSGLEFYFMVNHLYRSRAEARLQQAEMLNDWINLQDLPVIAVGDYNFDYDLDSGEGNPGFDAFVEEGMIVWIEPELMIKSQCSPDYNSILDFVFINDDALTWEASSEIIVRENDCGNEDYYSDHRPVVAVLDPTPE